MSSEASYRSFERHLLRAVISLASEPGLPAAHRLRWIAAAALKGEEPAGLSALMRELEPETPIAANHLRRAIRSLTNAQEG